MDFRLRWSSFVRLSMVGLVAATVCLSPLLPSRDRRGGLTFILPSEVQDSQAMDVVKKYVQTWKRLPSQKRQQFLKAHRQDLIRGFTSSIVSSMEAATDRTLSSKSYWDLVDACSHALGPIVIEMVGSRTRRTAAIQDNDLDFQVIRDPRSERKDEPFTDDDMQKVARNLEMLHCVRGPVKVGNVAIKFKMRTRIDNIDMTIRVDLVLWRPRREEFPRLRGGEDFYNNSARINKFLEQTPAARAAIIGVKSLQLEDRPKGILLEAIVWRLSKTCPFQLTRTARVFAGSEEDTWKLQKECLRFFHYVLNMLKDWKESPFGSDLEKDLAMLPEKKQEEHIQRFDKLRESSKDYLYLILVVTILRTAQKKWTKEDGPWHLYLDRELGEFFPSEGKRTNRLNKRRENRRRGAKVLGERTQDSCLTNGVDIL